MREVQIDATAAYHLGMFLPVSVCDTPEVHSLVVLRPMVARMRVKVPYEYNIMFHRDSHWFVHVRVKPFLEKMSPVTHHFPSCPVRFHQREERSGTSLHLLAKLRIEIVHRIHKPKDGLGAIIIQSIDGFYPDPVAFTQECHITFFPA
jgi:hypothetical protein